MSSVAIFDRNPSLAEALSSQLTAGNSVQCSGFSFECEVHKVIGDLKPDLVVIDPAHLELSQSYDIADFCDGVRDISADSRLLCYSFDISTPMIDATMEAGFNGCLSKYCPWEQLELAIRVVLSGGVYFDRVFGEKLLSKNGAQERDLLSAREKEVLTRFAKGLASKQIAFDLEISAKTVETYKSRAVQKLGLSDRSQIVEYALAQNWI